MLTKIKLAIEAIAVAWAALKKALARVKAERAVDHSQETEGENDEIDRIINDRLGK